MLLGAIFSASPLASSAENQTPEAALPLWSRLVFETKQASTKVTARIALHTLTADESANALLPTPPEYQPVEHVQPILQIHVQIEAKALFGTKRWSGSSWFEAGNARILQRIRSKPGSDGSEKRFRFTTEGVYKERAEPIDPEEAERPANEWSRVNGSFYPLGDAGKECNRISDPLALLYVMTAREIEPEVGQSLCVFNKKGLYRARLEAIDTLPLDVDYRLVDAGGVETSIKGKIEAQVLQVDAIPVAADAKELDPFEFIGLEGKIQLSIDPDTGMPVLIQGGLKGFGEASLKLSRAEQRRPRPAKGPDEGTSEATTTTDQAVEVSIKQSTTP